jgi:hypothetical protein
MFKKLVAVFCVLGVAAAFCAGTSYAAGGAIIKSCEGNVQVKAIDSEKWVEAKPGMALKDGDSIKTGAGIADVEYADKSVLKIKNDTNMTISEMKDAKSGQLTRKIKLMMGDVWASITPGTPTKTEFETPSAVAAVKGTVLSLSVSSTGVTQIMTTSGMVTLAMGTSYSVDLGNGQSVQVALNPAGGVTVSSLAGDITVNVANGSSIQISAGSGFNGAADGAAILVQSGSATVTPADGTNPQTLTAGGNDAAMLNPDGTVGPAVPFYQLPANVRTNMAGLVGAESIVPQQDTSGDSTTIDGKSIAPANNGNPYVNPEGGNIGDKQSVSPSNP